MGSLPARVILLGLASVGASFLAPPPAQTRQPVSAMRAVRMQAPAATEEKPQKSFVQTEMRSAAMKLHTRDQSPKEGEQPAEKPVAKWEPGRAEYLQFLVDSRHVYQCFEEIVSSNGCSPASATRGSSAWRRSRRTSRGSSRRASRPA